MTTSDKRIEAAAKAMHDFPRDGFGPYESASSDIKRLYRAEATNALQAADAADDHIRVTYRLARWAIETMELQSGGKPVPAADALREAIDIDEAAKAERARHGDDEL